MYLSLALKFWTCLPRGTSYFHSQVTSSFGRASPLTFTRKSAIADFVPFGTGSPLWHGCLIVVQSYSSCELETAIRYHTSCFLWTPTVGLVCLWHSVSLYTLPRGATQELYLFPIRCAGSHSRHCLQVPHRVALYALLSCLWRKNPAQRSSILPLGATIN